MTPVPTSLLRAIPAMATCSVCDQELATQVFDPELNGRICPSCAQHLGKADYLLNAIHAEFGTPILARPLGLGQDQFYNS